MSFLRFFKARFLIALELAKKVRLVGQPLSASGS